MKYFYISLKVASILASWLKGEGIEDVVTTFLQKCDNMERYQFFFQSCVTSFMDDPKVLK